MTQSIDEKFLNRGDLFALRYDEGLVFFEIKDFEEVSYEPYNNVGEIPAGGTVEEQRLDDPNGDDILYTEKSNNKVKHAAIGMSSGFIRRYTRYPEGGHRLRQISNLSTPKVGDDYGFVDGADSPYGDPTDAEELYIPPGINLGFEFANSDPTKAHSPSMHIKFREYTVDVLDPEKSKNKGAIKKIMSRGSPIPIAPVGSSDSQVSFNMVSEWGVAPVPEDRVIDML